MDPQIQIREEDAKRCQVAKLLVDHRANPNHKEQKGLQTPLHLCGMNGYAKTATVLLETGKADINAVNKLR